MEKIRIPGRNLNRELIVMTRIVSILFWIGLVATTAQAQYFGQNRVRYRSPDFKVLKTDHFDIHYYDDHEAAAVDFGRMAERWYTRLSTVLNHELSSRQPIILYASHTDFRGTTVIDNEIGETTGGMTEGLRRRIVMPLAGPLGETDHVLGHELVHAFQFDISSRTSGGIPIALTLPLWFVEGMAEYLTIGASDPHTAMWMRDAVLQGELPAVSALEDPEYSPYRWGQAFWSYVAGRYGDRVIGEVLKAAASDGNAQGAITAVLDIDLDGLSRDWHAALESAYRPVLQATVPLDPARELIGKRRGGAINVSPVLSPDGAWVAFFSEKSLFSIDLFLADARTGKIRRTLTRTVLDPNFDSLQFTNSAGAWSPDGREFAFGSVRAGRPEVSIYNLGVDRVTRRHRLADVTDLFSLSWAPDGSAIVFSGMAGGYTDLFILDLWRGTTRRLTDDAYSALHPAWSPDGRSIVFSTDRFSSDLSRLSFGDLRLGLIDVATGEIRPVEAFPSGKHLGAQWSADGDELFFISDRDGIPNVYRLNLRSGAIRQLTRLQTGVSGISKWSPAFSVAPRAGRLVYIAYVDGDYAVYRLEGAEELAGVPLDGAVAALGAGDLPPRERGREAVRPYLAEAATGLAAPAAFEKTDYKPSLGLDYVAPPSVSIGFSNFGSMVGGGIGFYWSDLLGYHNLMTAFQTATTIDGGKFLNSLSGIAAYTNRKSRWNWGLSGGQVPYLTGAYGRTLETIGGKPYLLDRTVRFWEISRQAAVTLARPTSRAQRFEFSGGFQNISYDAEGRIEVYSGVTGEFLGEERYDIDTPDSLNLGMGSAAMVYDASVFGGTSPIMGLRYRMEAGISGGSLTFSTLLVDYRRYARIAGPLSLAGRVLHYGRYGGDSEDRRLSELSLGYPSLVRGYEPGSFSPKECAPGTGGELSCPTFDRIFGSRLLVGNVEARLQTLGPLGIIPSRSFPPVETAIFYDAGLAWRSKRISSALGIPRRPVSSWGGSLRFNAMGFFIAQLSYVHANDRPARRWGWEFSIIPGF